MKNDKKRKDYKERLMQIPKTNKNVSCDYAFFDNGISPLMNTVSLGSSF